MIRHGETSAAIAPGFRPATDGRGFAAWRTRRRNAYRSALGRLDSRNLDELLLAFSAITEFIAPAIPPGASLPGGYAFAVNRQGEATLTRGGHMLNPGFGDALPSLETALEFAADLRGAWLDRVAQSLGLTGRWDLEEGACVR